MANTITEVIPKLLAQGLLALRENAIMPRLVNTNLQNLASQKGDVINVPIPSSITARSVTPSVTLPSNQDFTPTSAVVTLDFWREATFQLSDTDMVSVMDGTIPMQASEAVKALSNAVDDYIIGKHTAFFGAAGTSGTTPFATTIGAASTARKLLNQQLAPLDNRSAVLDPDAEANLLQLSNVLDTDKRGDTGGIINGSIGTKLGFAWHLDQNITTFAAGTGWADGNTASTVSGAIGDSTLNIINATASGAIKVGDIFHFTGDTLSRQYVVTAAQTISAAVAALIDFYPPLKTVVDTGATLVVVSGTYVANLAFHRDAMAWASRPLQEIDGLGNQVMTAVDNVSGIALRLEVSRQNRQTTFAYDILGGAAVIRKELGVKILG